MHTPFPPILAVIGTIAMLSLSGCSRSRDPIPVVYRTAGAVEGFELRHNGFSTARRHPGNFSLGYAVWANYPFLIYRGEVYRQAGVGSVFIRPADGLAAQYIVEETALEPEGPLGNPRTELLITDRASGQVLAQRILREGQVENGHGWAGQHAAEFVRRVLHTRTPIGGPVGTKSYGKAVTTLELLMDAVPPVTQGGGVGCPATYRLAKERQPTGLDTGAWVFVPQNHIHSFACDGNYILTQSGYGNWLHLDLLTSDGKHVFQTDLHTPVEGSAEVAITRLRLEHTRSASTAMQIDVFYGEAKGLNKQVPAQLFRATIQLPPANVR